MENPKIFTLLNYLSWVVLIAFAVNFLWSQKGCGENAFQKKAQADRNSPEFLKQNLKQVGPYLFWRGDTLDVHTVEAGFMQYYEPKKRSYTRKEAENMIFDCFTANREDKISLKLHAIKRPPSTYEMPEKMLILGGDASNFEGFKKALIGNGVMDKAFNWTFGKGHLVIKDCPIYSSESDFLHWLLYKLEEEAEKAGGQIHLIFGQDPFRFIKKTEKGSSDSRSNFLKLQNWESDSILQKNSELRRWLYSKNVVENIGGYLIAESGLSEDLIDGLPLDTINSTFVEAFGLAKMGDYGQFYIEDNLQKSLLKPKAIRGNYRYTDILFGNIAYMNRNMDKHYKANDSDKRVDRLLKLYDAKHFIGRFPPFSGTIATENSNKFIGYIPDMSRQGGGSISTNDIRYEGVWIEKNQIFVVDDEGKKTLLF